MNASAKIKKIEKFIHQADNQTYLEVEFDILLDGEVKEIRKLSFPLDIDAKTIEAELKKYALTYADDQRLAKEAEKVEAAHKKADETIASLTGKEIK